MTLINITPTESEDLFAPPEFPVLSPGRHTFVVANDLKVETKEETGNGVIKVEARCQDEDENKGIPVFDNIVIINNPMKDKDFTAKSIHDKKLAQFTVACGVLTKEQVEAGEGINLAEFKDKMFLAVSGVETQKYQGRDVKRSCISRYLFEPDDTGAENVGSEE